MKKKKYLLLLIPIILIGLTATFSRYIYNKLSEHYLESKEFYFYSDVLTIDNKTYTAQNWDGTISYIIPLIVKNYKNDLAITADDINYELSINCPDNATCTSDLTGNIDTLTGGEKSETKINITVVMNDKVEAGDKVKVEVTAKSTSTYKKTLKGNFNIEISDTTFEIDDKENRAYLVLRLANATPNTHTYKLSFDPTILNIDMTNSLVINGTKSTTTINNETFINGLEVIVSGTNSEEILFYKNDITKDYSYPITNETPIITVE